jgi:AraC family transcriptional regulator
MAKLFAQHGDYIDEVKFLSSDHLSWPGLRLSLTRESSNDLMFTRMARHALTLELTGAARHLTHMDGIAAERATQVDDVCQMPAGVSARFAWDVTGTQSSIVVEFGEELLTTYCPERLDGRMAQGHLTPRDYAPAPALAALIRLLAREIEPGQERGPLFADMLIRLLAIEICETAWTRRPPGARDGPAADRRMIRATDFIEAHLGSRLSLRDVAAASGLSIGALARLFPHHTGSSPYAYIIRKRVERAKQLLQSSDMPIAQVAVETGFADQAHMTRVFTRHLGQTPRSLRQALSA